MPEIFQAQKPPHYECDDCGFIFSHFSGQMLMLKEEVWLSIAKKEEILCDKCIHNRLGRKVSLSELWTNKEGEISFLNDWYVKELTEN